MKKDEFDCYLIETFQDYLNYKQARQRREKEIKSIKRESKYKSEESLCDKKRIEKPVVAGENCSSLYHTSRNSILIDSILSYVEDMCSAEIDDAKTIQLMLMKLVFDTCDEKTLKRIMNVDRVVAKKAANSLRFEYGSNNTIYAGGK